MWIEAETREQLCNGPQEKQGGEKETTTWFSYPRIVIYLIFEKIVNDSFLLKVLTKFLLLASLFKLLLWI